MDEEKANKSESKRNRDGDGRFLPGHQLAGPGRPEDTEEKKIEKKAIKQLVEEYREKLADSLDKINPVLVAKALTGDVSAIKEVHEVVGSHAPKKQDITSDGKQIILQISEEVAKKNGINSNSSDNS